MDGVQELTREPVEELAALVRPGGVLVLSGAGLSTESGIPDYRGPTGTLRRATPMTYQTFVGDTAARRRYWARSHLGWSRMRGAGPNDGHRALAAIDPDLLITQNVDGLHQAGGATGVVELHGSLAEVTCLTCGELLPRGELDRRLREANPAFDAQIAAVNPDGDVDLADDDLSGFHVVGCGVCGDGVLKPDVVFFGESVPRARVAQCFELVAVARALVVLGSSLKVMSGRRFVLAALKRGIPVAIVNQGATPVDDRVALTVSAPLGVVLPRLVELCRMPVPTTAAAV